MNTTQLLNKTPKRIQRKRSKGWRIPENTVYVGRGSKYGNQFKIGADGDANQCIAKYMEYRFPYTHHGEHNSMQDFMLSKANLQEATKDLRGKNLACWCKIGDPCHADSLLEIVNA